VPLWRWQALGIFLAVIAVAAWFVLMGLVPLPFWTFYVLVILVGGGVLVAVHARILETQASTSPSLLRTARDPYDIGSKISMIGFFVGLFASLSVENFRQYAWLAHPLMVGAYVLLGLTFVLAASDPGGEAIADYKEDGELDESYHSRLIVWSSISRVITEFICTPENSASVSHCS
jgi:hypothetical protein